ncbi:putative F-box/LRR-repeat protein 8 [Glycine soja]
MGGVAAVTIDDIPDNCLACIFQLFPPADQKKLSLVCRRWLKVEGHTHHRLCLTLPYSSVLASIFSRFDSVTDLTLQCPNLMSMCDGNLVVISDLCPNLIRLQITKCSYLSYAGLEVLARSCERLKSFSCTSCTFGPNSIDALIHHCTTLEQLSIEYSTVTTHGAQFLNFYPLIRAKNLTTVKIVQCSVEEYWDMFFHSLASQVTSLLEVHLDGCGVSDNGLRAISKFPNLETLHLVKTHKCTHAGLVAVAEGCNKSLRKLCINVSDWKGTNKIGDKGLIAFAKCCSNLQELVLIGMNPSKASLKILASNCQSLEHLGLWGSNKFGDTEICCIAGKCVALKELHIERCPRVYDRDIKTLAAKCPNLVRVKVFECKWVTERDEYVRYHRRLVHVTCKPRTACRSPL